jgi:hypothetical protein
MPEPCATAWQDISEHATCFRHEGDHSVGSRDRVVFWHEIAGKWAWHVERVNKTGPTRLASGFAPSAEEAQAFADAWPNCADAGPLFERRNDAPAPQPPSERET